MPPVTLDARAAELAHLDVIDIREDGTLVLNPAFRAACIAALDADPRCIDTVVQDHILARAVERGFAGCVDIEELAFSALEIGIAEEEPDARA